MCCLLRFWGFLGLGHCYSPPLPLLQLPTLSKSNATQRCKEKEGKEEGEIIQKDEKERGGDGEMKLLSQESLSGGFMIQSSVKTDVLIPSPPILTAHTEHARDF